MKSGVALLTFILFLTSCKSQKNPFERISEKLSLGSQLPLRKEIPEIENKSSLHWSLIKEEEFKLKLPSLENGSENLQIRIWEELDWGKTVFIMTYLNNSWI